MTTAFELKEMWRTDGSNGQTDLSSGNKDAAGLIQVEQGGPMQDQPNFSKFIRFAHAWFGAHEGD